MVIGGSLGMAQEFEVASIKQNTSCANRPTQSIPSPGRFTLECQTVKSLIQVAYGALADGVSFNRKMLDVTGGPGWMESDRYDIAAKAEGAARVEQMGGPMMRALLEDRFKLKVHRESKESSVYFLEVGKGGSKLVRTKEGSCVPIDLNHLQRPTPGETPPNYCGNTRVRRKGTVGMVMTLDANGISLADLTGGPLHGLSGRPVIDKTELEGLFNVHMEFTPEGAMGGMGGREGAGANGAPAPPVDPGAPSIFTAVQEQLGLKLVPGKGPIDVLVVDHLERPSEN